MCFKIKMLKKSHLYKWHSNSLQWISSIYLPICIWCFYSCFEICVVCHLLVSKKLIQLQFQSLSNSFSISKKGRNCKIQTFFSFHVKIWLFHLSPQEKKWNYWFPSLHKVSKEFFVVQKYFSTFPLSECYYKMHQQIEFIEKGFDFNSQYQLLFAICNTYQTQQVLELEWKQISKGVLIRSLDTYLLVYSVEIIEFYPTTIFWNQLT